MLSLLPIWLKGIAKVFIFLFFFIVFEGLGQSLIAFILSRVYQISFDEFFEMIQSPKHHEKLLIFEFANVIIEISIILLFQKYETHQISLKKLGFVLENKGIEFLTGSALGILLISIGFIIMKIMGFVQVISLEFHPIIFISYIIFFLLVAFIEELMARGLVLNLLMESMNKYVALLISALIFSGLHVMNNHIDTVPLINLFIAGILLGIFFVIRKSLMFPIGLHFTWNFFQGSIYGFEVSGHEIQGIVHQQTFGNILWTGGAFGFEGSIIAFPLMLFGIIFIYFFYKSSSKALKE
jgi:uncharacterized protein